MVTMTTRGLCIQCLLQGYLDNGSPRDAFVDSVEEHLRRCHANEDETIRARVELEERLQREKGMSLPEFFIVVGQIAAEMAFELALEMEAIEDGDVTVH